MLKLTLIVLVACLTFNYSIGQKKPRFSGEEQLKSCEVEIPLYYSTKNQSALNEAVEKYRNLELVLVTINKKKEPTYKFYYLEPYDSDFGPSAYLVETKNLNKDRRPEHVMFLDYNPKKHIFYSADCFKHNLASEELKLEE